VRNVIIGALVGFAVGWLVFAERGRPRRAERDAALPVVATAESPRRTEAPTPEPETKDTLTGEQIRIADAQTIRRIAFEVDNSNRPTAADVVEAAIVRSDAARTARDWKLFSALVQFLAASKSPAAQAKLIDLMGDTSLKFHDWRVAEHFTWGLSTTEVDGVVRAARDRIEMETKEYTDANRWAAWYEIVAQHGSTDDVAWLVAHARRTRDGMRYIAAALADGAANPAATQHLLLLWEEGSGLSGGEGAAKAFAKNNPKAALPFFRERLLDWRRGDSRDTARHYGMAVTTATLAEAKAFLLGLGPAHQRCYAVDAVTAMQRNKLDISGLEPIARAPAEYARQLISADARSRREAFYDVLYGIDYNQITWSEATAQALDDLGNVYGNKERADAYVELARRIRAKIGSGSSAWVTKD